MIFTKKINTQSTPENNLKIGRIVVLVTGLLGVAASTYLIMANESEIWDAFNSLLGLMGGQ